MTEKEPYNPERYSIVPMSGNYSEILHEHGSIVFSFYPRGGLFNICTLDVDKDWRREGIGKNMLRYTRELATELGARVIVAGITSRESLDVMTAVFGADALSVGRVGQYMPPGVDKPVNEANATSAALWYEVPPAGTEGA